MLVTDLEYALDKKVEQDLWNHAFKNQITTLQSQAKNRANPNRSEVQANLSLFLEAASGFYTQLLQELCNAFNVDLPCRVKSSQLGIISNKQSSSSAIVTPQPSSCSYICQHCLVHLGDIARYRNQTSQAESYYRHAAQLVPSNGQPYNQLAILASSKGDHLTTIFYYCRSIAVKFPFPAASTNLQKALSKALESRDEAKTKWTVSDFIKAFIKFHGHVYLSRSVDKLDVLREKLEEQFQRLIVQKAFSSQQLVHITVINLFELHHLRDLTSDSNEQSYSSEQQISWFQQLGLFMSFLGVMCSRVLLNNSHGEEIMGECPLPAVKVSLDWLKLRPSVFHDAAVDKRQHVWPWFVSILNSFQPKEDDVSCPSVTPLPEEFELQGFLALRPALRSLDFAKGHQGILMDRERFSQHTRHQRLIGLGKWVADNQPGLMQCRVSEDGLLVFFTEIPEQAVEALHEKEVPVHQESSNGVQVANDATNVGLKSALSPGKGQSSSPDSKENIKPREQNPRESLRNHLKDSVKERRDFSKANGAAVKELKRDGKRKTEPKKTGQERTADTGKQVKAQTELRKTPVSEAKKTPVTQTQTTCSSQFIPIHHPGAFPPLPSRPAFVIRPPVALPGGFALSGVSIAGPFLHQAVHGQGNSPGQAGKQSHSPYSQQRPSGPAQGTGSSGQSPCGPMNQSYSSPAQQSLIQPPPQLQVHLMSPQHQQQQQSPTKPGQQVGMGKSAPHHPGHQQYKQVQEQQAHMWTPKASPVQMPMKQQVLYNAAQDSLKLYENQQPFSNVEKKIKYPDTKLQDLYWEHRLDELPLMAERMKRPPPGTMCPEQEAPAGPRVHFFEDNKTLPLLPPDLLKTLADFEEEEELIFTKPPDFFQALAGPLNTTPGPNLYQSNQNRMESGPEGVGQSSSLLPMSCFQMQEYSNYSRAFRNMLPNSKPECAAMHQDPSLYNLFGGNLWSPPLPASSDHSTPASQSPHSSNPSSLPSSPPNTQPWNHALLQLPDNRDHRGLDRWKGDKMGSTSGFGLDFLPTATQPTASDTSWHPRILDQSAVRDSWANQESAMEESSSVLLDSFKSIWSSSMMQPGPSALEQLLQQQKQQQQQQRGGGGGGHSGTNPPH
uniref:Nonsense-mediated mRNA decay factor n=2 Tax=Gouania willdenowi TaxID=441366 RepID=A0A8C5H371_GOUWI